MIPLSSLLFLVFGFAAAKALSKDFLAPFLDHGGGVLLSYLITFVGFIVSLRGGTGSGAARRRFWVLLTATVFLVGMVTWRQSLVRMNTFTRIHDGAIQTEVAADFLLHGINPYVADFRPTAFGQAPSPYRPDAVNLAWTHYAYPPAVFLSAVPNILLRPWFGPLTDLRWLYLGALLAATAAMVSVLRTWEQRSLAVVLMAANPFLWLYAVAGFNDVLAVATMVLSAVAIERKRWRGGGVLMGIALAAKQTTWLALPLWLWWLWRRRQAVPAARPFHQALWPMVIVTGAFYLPFFLWNPAAMYDDLVRYVSGSIPFAYPISGSTFLQFLRLGGVIDSPWDIIPIWPWQLIAGLVAGWVGWRWIRRRPDAATWLAASAVMTLSVAMFSRFFNDNYLSAIVLLGTAAYLLHHEPERRQ